LAVTGTPSRATEQSTKQQERRRQSRAIAGLLGGVVASAVSLGALITGGDSNEMEPLRGGEVVSVAAEHEFELPLIALGVAGLVVSGFSADSLLARRQAQEEAGSRQ
jgi:hypothetical protein